MLYFAYGSNLSEQNRIKNNINITKVKNYKLKGYRICFRNPYGDPDIEKTSKGFVNGVLFKINSFQELNLDRYENFPSYYLFNPTSPLGYRWFRKCYQPYNPPPYNPREGLPSPYPCNGQPL